MFIQQICTKLPGTALPKEQRSKGAVTIGEPSPGTLLALGSQGGSSRKEVETPGEGSGEGCPGPVWYIRLKGARPNPCPDLSFFCFQPMTLVL